MGQCLITRKGVKSRKYIFKDGKFNIAPTTNIGNILSDGTWTVKNNDRDKILLSIPYDSSDEIFFVKFNHSGYGNHAYDILCIGNGKIEYAPYGQGRESKRLIIWGMETATSIILKNGEYGNSTYIVYEIWTEKK